MELFARNDQHNPLAMLRDLIRLYALTYGISYADAVKAIRKDAPTVIDHPNVNRTAGS